MDDTWAKASLVEARKESFLGSVKMELATSTHSSVLDGQSWKAKEHSACSLRNVLVEKTQTRC